ncbi:MAG: hypothetical protein JXA21_11315 [Anaerolineae bacterium]|nr:hypothetical protein [Anaerolineae bacterium]
MEELWESLDYWHIRLNRSLSREDLRTLVRTVFSGAGEIVNHRGDLDYMVAVPSGTPVHGDREDLAGCSLIDA